MLASISDNPYFVWGVVCSLIALALVMRSVFNTDDEYRHKAK